MNKPCAILLMLGFLAIFTFVKAMNKPYSAAINFVATACQWMSLVGMGIAIGMN